MAEIQIKCPHCYSQEKCFEETVERKDDDDFKSYLCFNCGYTSNSLYSEESKVKNQHLESTAQIIRDWNFLMKNERYIGIHQLLTWGLKVLFILKEMLKIGIGDTLK